MGLHILLNCTSEQPYTAECSLQGACMDVETFRQEVARAGRHLPAESLTLALRHYVEHVERFTPESVRQCVQLAGLLAESATTSTTAAERADLPQTPTSVALSEHLRGKL